MITTIILFGVAGAALESAGVHFKTHPVAYSVILLVMLALQFRAA